MTDSIDDNFREELYEAEKVLMEDFVWERRQQNPARYSASTRVRVVGGDETLTVRGEYWERGFSFALTYRNQVIRRWDFNNHHSGISGGHKHRSTSVSLGEDDPYSVDDVSTSSPRQGLIDFLEEANIREGQYSIEHITSLSDYE